MYFEIVAEVNVPVEEFIERFEDEWLAFAIGGGSESDFIAEILREDLVLAMEFSEFHYVHPL